MINTLGLTEEEYWGVYAVQGYKRALIICETREKLGEDIDKTLKGLREEVEIKYYK